MTDMTQNGQIDQQGQEELRDLDVPAAAAREVKGGKVSVQDVSNTRGAGKPFVSGNHNETLVRQGTSFNHNETLVLHDLDLPEAEAEGVKGGALGDINGESQDNWHAAEIEVVSWKLSGAPDRPRRRSGA